MSRLYVAILKEVVIPNGYLRHCEACGVKYRDEFGRVEHMVAQNQDKSFAIKDESDVLDRLSFKLAEALNEITVGKRGGWLDRIRKKSKIYTLDEVQDALDEAFHALLEEERQETVRVP